MSDVEKLRVAIEDWRMSDEPSDDHEADLFRVIDAAGFAVVPKVATEEMRLAMAKADSEGGNRYRDMAAAMLAAAPKVLP